MEIIYVSFSDDILQTPITEKRIKQRFKPKCITNMLNSQYTGKK